jgi:hypothetical protein
MGKWEESSALAFQKLSGCVKELLALTHEKENMPAFKHNHYI